MRIELFQGYVHPFIDDVFTIRYAVFVEEQKFLPEDEFEPADVDAWHALLFYDTIPVATGRMVTKDEKAHIGRLAVLPSYRKHGYGGMIVKALSRLAVSQSLAPIMLYAQEHAIPFYEKLGFTKEGDLFFMEGMLHQYMEQKYPHYAE